MEQLPKTDIRVVDEFDFELFWQHHGKKVSTGVIAVVVFGLVAFYWQRQQAEKSAEAAMALARAQDAGSLETLIRDFDGQEVAAQAMLRLADVQYNDHLYTDAADTYSKFIERYPRHSMIEAAGLGLAASTEARGDVSAAKAQYEQLVRNYPSGYTVIPAKLGLARCAEVSGQTKEAKQIYEELLPAVQGTSWQGEIYLRWVTLSREQLTEIASADSSALSLTGGLNGSASMLPDGLPQP